MEASCSISEEKDLRLFVLPEKNLTRLHGRSYNYKGFLQVLLPGTGLLVNKNY